jgi:hypothetical protein
MTNTHRSPISQQRLDRNRDSKRPTQADQEQALREFPNDFGAAVIRTQEIAYRRRWGVKS